MLIAVFRDIRRVDTGVLIYSPHTCTLPFAKSRGCQDKFRLGSDKSPII